MSFIEFNEYSSFIDLSSNWGENICVVKYLKALKNIIVHRKHFLKNLRNSETKASKCLRNQSWLHEHIIGIYYGAEVFARGVRLVRIFSKFLVVALSLDLQGLHNIYENIWFIELFLCLLPYYSFYVQNKHGIFGLFFSV